MKTDRKTIARWLQDKTTIEKNISFINDNKNNPTNLKKALDVLRVLPKNWGKYKKELEKVTEEIVNKQFPKGIPGIDFSFNEFYNIKYDKETGDEINRKVNIDKVAEYLMELFSFKTIFQTKTEEIFVYDNGIYLKKGKEIIRTQVEEILKEYSTSYNVREVEEKIKRLTAINKEEFEKIPEDLICLENGILNVRTKKLEEHNPDHYFKTKLSIKYNEKLRCPRIIKFFKEVLYEEDIKVMEEWFGYNLYKRYFIKKAMILFGKKDTGKTILLNLLMKFLDRKNTSGISLQRISSGDKFALSSLKDKVANIFDDLSSKDLSDQGGFKIATGGGFITAEYKFGDSFQFLNYAKHIFATNKIPPVEDVEDDAYYDRWIPIPFDNQFKKKDQDKFLINKLTTPKELSGLLNLTLKGLSRLLKKGMFSYKKDSKEIKQIMERHSNSLSAFVQDVLIQKPGNKISKDDMYNIYSIYVRDNNLLGILKYTKLSKSQLGRRLPKCCYYILAKIDKIRYWENVGITDLHINLNTFNASQQIINANKFINKLNNVNCIDKNSGEALKALKEEHNKTLIKPEDFK